ncbi:MAG: hypothetical protein FVQ79_00630 [Planctomycetes bacterium]|nr:hypothetical protein [Planctomycetota bacterium]
MSNLELQRNRLRRLRVLQILYSDRPEMIGEGMIFQLLRQDADLDPTQDGVRRSLDYLEQRGYVQITNKDSKIWIAKITADGVDYLEGPDPGVQGMAHPSEFMR